MKNRREYHAPAGSFLYSMPGMSASSIGLLYSKAGITSSAKSRIDLLAYSEGIPPKRC